ncbi:MAG: acylphosphatase [Actinomycetota bacterium]
MTGAPGQGDVRAHVVAFGRVQGVWYRQSCWEEAHSAGVRGWVRNRPDGAVEAVLEGSPSAVEQVIAWMRTGPPRAVVEHLDVAREPPQGEGAFEVR